MAIKAPIFRASFEADDFDADIGGTGLLTGTDLLPPGFSDVFTTTTAPEGSGVVTSGFTDGVRWMGSDEVAGGYQIRYEVTDSGGANQNFPGIFNDGSGFDTIEKFTSDWSIFMAYPDDMADGDQTLELFTPGARSLKFNLQIDKATPAVNRIVVTLPSTVSSTTNTTDTVIATASTNQMAIRFRNANQLFQVWVNGTLHYEVTITGDSDVDDGFSRDNAAGMQIRGFGQISGVEEFRIYDYYISDPEKTVTANDDWHDDTAPPPIVTDKTGLFSDASLFNDTGLFVDNSMFLEETLFLD